MAALRCARQFKGPAVVHADSLTWFTETLNQLEPILISLVTPVFVTFLESGGGQSGCSFVELYNLNQVKYFSRPVLN